jgi:MFS family permease
MVGAGAGSLVLGRLLDRFGFFKIALLASTATGLGLILAGSAKDLVTMHLAYGLLVGGVGQGAFFGPLAAAVSQWFDRHRTLAIAIAASGQSIGGLLLPPLLRWSAEEFGWRGTLQMYGAVAGLVLLGCSFVFRRAPPPHLTETPGQRTVASAPGISRNGFALLGLCMALFNLASFVVIGHLTAFGEEQGFPPAVAAAVVSAMLGVTLVSRLSLGPVSERWGRYRALVFVSAMHLVGVCMLATIHSYVALVIAVLLIGLGFGGYVPAYAVLARELFPARQAGQRITEIYFFAFMAAGAGSWTGGWLRDWSGGYSVPFEFAAASACAGACILLGLRRQLNRL